MRARACWLLPAAALLLGAYFVFAWELVNRGSPNVSFDTYQYFYPNMLHAARSVADGGRGFFWNAMLNCGQPFFGISSTSTLYPLHWLFLVADADVALRAVLVLDLAIAGIGAYLLCREIGAGRLAAACGAMCFELGNSTLQLASWMPLALAPYVWLPVVMLCCERVLSSPSSSRAVALAASLAMATLSGYPQIIVFTCQLVGLRVVWELLTRRGGRRIAALAAVGSGFVLAVLLAAVEIVPAIDTGRASVRGLPLTRAEILAEPNVFRWPEFLRFFDQRRPIFNPIVVVPAAVGAAALVGIRNGRRALFYAGAGALYFALSLGDATPLFDLYLKVPFGALFRDPARFLWMTSFCLAVVCALGVEALLGPRAFGSSGRRLVGLAAFGTAAAGLQALAPSGLRGGDWLLLAVVATAAGVAMRWPARRRLAGLAMAAAIAVNLVAFPLLRRLGPAVKALSLRELPIESLIPDGGAFLQNAAVFEAVRGRMTAQDRVYLVHPQPSVSFAPKTGAVFGVPAVQDYEPQPSRRFAEYFVLMRRGRKMTRAVDFYDSLRLTLFSTFQRRLLDLTAARFLLVDRRVDLTRTVFKPPPRVIRTGPIRLYENTLALPRARYVPRVQVVPDPVALLHQLAHGSDDLRRVALLEAPLASGFSGPLGGEGSGEVEFVRNDPEHVVLRVQASERGFLHLADQYAAGWYATVNGAPVEIARANYLFRLVEVPAGESIVEFRYAPASVWLGALVSGLTVVGLVVFAVRSRRREA